MLDRSSDPAGLQGWLIALSGGASRADVVIGFANSAEFIANTEYPALGFFSDLIEVHLGSVFRAYGAVLDRLPDAGGFLGWVDLLDSGELTLQQVIDGFTGSAEFLAEFGGLNDTEFVTLLYNNVLDRAPDAAGLQAWLNLLASGTSRAEVVLGFSESPEYMDASEAALTSFVETLYADSADILNGGSGDDILFGGRGADTFIFDADEDGTNTIYGLDDFDTVQLDSFGYGSVSEAIANLTQSGSDVIFTDQGVTITFAESTLADVSDVLSVPSLLGLESSKISTSELVNDNAMDLSENGLGWLELQQSNDGQFEAVSHLSQADHRVNYVHQDVHTLLMYEDDFLL